MDFKSCVFSSFDLSGKYALITGASGLLGPQHALALLECGANIILTDINAKALTNTVDKLCEVYGNSKCMAFVMDVTSEESIDFVRSELAKQDVFVDILINNAAIDPKVSSGNALQGSRLENYSVDSWDLEVKVGLRGAFLCSKVFGSDMFDKKRRGVILNIASDLGVIAPDQRLYTQPDIPAHLQPVKPVTYSVIKHGLIGLTKYLATYWEDGCIRCNALSPGGIFTNQPDLFVNKLTELIPMRRMAKVNEYQSAIAFLCSEASSYLNGQNIIIDGGRSIL